MKTTKPKSLMRRLLTFTAVLGLAAFGTGVASAQSSPVLFNGNVNLITLADTPGNPPVGWTALGTLEPQIPGIGAWLDSEASEPWANSPADPNPAGYGLFFKPFEGVTNANPTLDYLADCYFYQDNPSVGGTAYTLSAYVGAGGTYSGYQTNVLNYDYVSGTYVYPVTALYVVFLDGSGGILQSNSYDLVAAGLQTTGNLGGGAAPNYQYTTPSYIAPAGTVTVRAGLEMLYQWASGNQPSLFADVFDLEATPPPGAPGITNQPAYATVPLGGTAIFNVGVSNTAGATYQWYGNSGALADSAGHISGSSTATLTITGVTTNDIGHYRAVVANGFGASFSATVPLSIVNINLFPTVGISGSVGDNWMILRSLSPSGPWTTNTTVRLSSSPQYIPDYTLPIDTHAFYQEVYLH